MRGNGLAEHCHSRTAVGGVIGERQQRSSGAGAEGEGEVDGVGGGLAGGERRAAEVGEGRGVPVVPLEPPGEVDDTAAGAGGLALGPGATMQNAFSSHRRRRKTLAKNWRPPP